MRTTTIGNWLPLKFFIALLIICVGPDGLLQAQDSEQETITLSPFEVTSEGDIGYQASNSVSATKLNVPLDETPIILNVLTQELLEDMGAYSVEDSIQYTTGVSLLGLPNNTSMVIRGFSSSGNLKQNGLDRPAGGPINPIMLSRVEIIKGPSTVLYGSANPGGLVNLITKTPSLVRSASTKLTMGSYNFHRAEIDATGPIMINADTGQSVAYRVGAAFENGNSIRDFEGWDKEVLFGNVRFQLNPQVSILLEASQTDWTWDARANELPVNFARDRIITALPRSFNPSTDENQVINNEDIQRALLDVKLSDEWDFRVSAQHTKRYFNNAIMNGFNAVTPENDFISQIAVDRRDHNESYNVLAELVGRYDFGSWSANFVAGYQYDKYETRERILQNRNLPRLPLYGPRPDDYVYKKFDEHPEFFTSFGRDTERGGENQSVFAVSKIDLLENRFHIFGGLRADGISNSAYGYDRNRAEEITATPEFPERDTQVVPQIGGLFEISDRVGIFANYSESFVPNTNFPNNPQVGTGVEFGAKFDFAEHGISGSVTYFDIELSAIERRNTSLPDQPITLSGTEGAKGVELETFVKLAESLQAKFRSFEHV